MLRRTIAIAGLALLPALASQALAQSASQTPAQPGAAAAMVTSFECVSALRPDQTTICSSPELAAMDIQMATLLTVVKKFVGTGEEADLQATQRVFLTERAKCAADFQCIGNAYIQRIGELAEIVNQAARALDGLREEAPAAQ